MQPFSKTISSERLEKRRREERRFRLYGQLGVGGAVALLCLLLFSIALEARTAFTQHTLRLTIQPQTLNTSGVGTAVSESLKAPFNDQGAETRRGVSTLISPLASEEVANHLTQQAAVIGQPVQVTIPLADQADLYLKGLSVDVRGFAARRLEAGQVFSERAADLSDVFAALQSNQRALIDRFNRRSLVPAELELGRLKKLAAGEQATDGIELRLEGAERRLSVLKEELAQMERLLEASEWTSTDENPSVLFTLETGTYRAITLTERSVQLSPLLGYAAESQRVGSIRILLDPEKNRALSDLQIAALDAFRDQGAVGQRFNGNLFNAPDSMEPELAGIAAGLGGSILIVIVTMFLAVPVGIAAAVYLEEFAPKTWLTQAIQVNINNLAAVPSIVFGLLGAAILLNGITIPVPLMESGLTLAGGLGRGWPLVGGLVLALMTLPTVIITTRAALAAVPNSIRNAALGLGATRLQAVGHHVLPKAAPGILTGSIIGLSQALGETAPLLLIGMVAFIAEVPSGLTERSTALPVLIYQWSTRAERAWEPMTSAAIIILLLVMLSFNALAIWLRLRYERS